MKEPISQTFSFVAILLLLLAGLMLLGEPVPAMGRKPGADPASRAEAEGESIVLPAPARTGTMSIEEAIARRRSIRAFDERPLRRDELSQLLWAAQGITGEGGFKRAAPSAGAKYPIELFVVVGEVEGISPGVYRYVPASHSLVRVRDGDHRETLCFEALAQEWVRDAPVALVITAIYGRTRVKYGNRAERYVHIEVGAVAENVYLEAESLGLGTTFVGAFSDAGVAKVLDLDEEAPLGIMPVGAVKRE
jgi:SagB-type dehydrogenase family enzyme